ncbi:MAG: hypothetical protein R6V07_08560, partial [Armatimonadota bacterium]
PPIEENAIEFRTYPDLLVAVEENRGHDRRGDHRQGARHDGGAGDEILVAAVEFPEYSLRWHCTPRQEDFKAMRWRRLKPLLFKQSAHSFILLVNETIVVVIRLL